MPGSELKVLDVEHGGLRSNSNKGRANKLEEPPLHFCPVGDFRCWFPAHLVPSSVRVPGTGFGVCGLSFRV